MNGFTKTLSLALVAFGLALSHAGGAFAQDTDEDAAFADIPDAPAAETPAPAPAPIIAEEEEGSLDMGGGEEEGSWGPAVSTDSGKIRLGVRGGFLFPATDYDYGPTAGVFMQKGISDKLKIEVELGHAQLASSNEMVNTSLWLGSAGAQFILFSMPSRDIYVQADIGAISEDAATAEQAVDSMISTFGISVGMLSSRVVDFRLGVSMLTNSENVDSVSHFKFGLLY